MQQAPCKETEKEACTQAQDFLTGYGKNTQEAVNSPQ